MRFFSFALFLFFTSYAHADIIDDCAKTTGDETFTTLMETRDEIFKVLNRQNEIEIDAQAYRQAALYLSALPKEERNQIIALLKKWQEDMPNSVNIAGTGKPVVFVHGIEDLDRFPFRWVESLHEALKSKRPIKLFSWQRVPSIDTNSQNLISEINSLLQAQKEDVDVIAYSAGGAIGMKALDYLKGEGKDERVHLNTIASPVFGYKAPTKAFFGVPFVGMSTIEIGWGVREHIHNKLNCTQWVTVDCTRDRHACPNKDGSYPQQGADMPCKEVKYLTTESHLSSLPYVTTKVLRAK